MHVLVLGSGGREHAIYQKLSESPRIEKMFAAPGNGGTLAEHRLPISNVTDFPAIEKLIEANDIDVLVVGPEAPLAEGIKDYFADARPSLLVFGPDKNAAQLEASKAFSWQFMQKYKIPTARSAHAKSKAEAIALLKDFPGAVVIKADGLAAGKGVSIHHDRGEAESRLAEIFDGAIFGEAGSTVLLQEFMTGTEASLFAILNGKDAVILPTARDYKPAYDANKGPNTGGMGSFCPGDVLTNEHVEYVHENIIKSVLKEFSYTGILYVGLMVHSSKADDLSVVEFNCRLGDPETQCVLPMLEADLFPYILWGCGQNEAVPRVKEKSYFHIPQRTGFSLNVVIAARGYPGAYEKEIPLRLPQKLPVGLHIIHAGTQAKSGDLVSVGGRILNLVGEGSSLEEARGRVYDFVNQLKEANDFERFHLRTDIGAIAS